MRNSNGANDFARSTSYRNLNYISFTVLEKTKKRSSERLTTCYLKHTAGDRQNLKNGDLHKIKGVMNPLPTMIIIITQPLSLF